MKSAPALTFDLVPSRRIALAATLVVVLAFVALATSGLPTPLKILLAAVVDVHAMVSLRRFLAPRWVRMARDATGWQLADRQRDAVVVELRRHSRRGPIIALEFKLPGGQRFRGIIDRVAVDADAWRRLVLVLAREPRAEHGSTPARSF